MITALLLLACTPAPSSPWMEQAALQRSLDALAPQAPLDAKAWSALSYKAPAFRQVDADHDGQLSPGELGELLRGQDPLGFDGQDRRAPPGPTSGKRPMPHEVRLVRDLLLFCTEELRAVNPDASLPTRRQISGAAKQRQAHSPPVRALFKQLREGWETSGHATPALVTQGERGELLVRDTQAEAPERKLRQRPGKAAP